MRLVVDASVAIKWFLRSRGDEPFVEEAETLAGAIERSDTQLFAPPHWIAEIVAVLSRLDGSVVDDALLLLDDMRPVVVAGMPALRRGADLAIELDHHLFDTLYHAVAIEEGATLVTADEVYFRKAQSKGAIQLLSSFTVP